MKTALSAILAGAGPDTDLDLGTSSTPSPGRPPTPKHFQTFVLACLAVLTHVSAALGQGSPFTYQGRLQTNGVPYTGSAEFEFTLWDAATAGATIAANNPATVVASVENGLFTATLDFGMAAFNGQPRFLQIAARTTLGPFTTLTPRQPLTSTPYALRAFAAASATAVSGHVPAAQLSGILSPEQLPVSVVTNGASGVSIAGTFFGSGAGITNLDLTLNSGGAMATSGGFALASSPNAGFAVVAITLADVNADGRPDVISADYNAGTLLVMTNSGRGDFAVSSTLAVGGGRIASVTAADVNGDGRPDLISAHFETSLLKVSLNTGGSFAPPSSLSLSSFPRAVTSADVNGDGKADLICARSTPASVAVLTNDGAGGFLLSTSPNVGPNPVHVASGDVNGDGKPDLIAVNNDDATLTVLTNNGRGGFAVSATPAVGSGPRWVEAVDVNRDGTLDLVAANGNGATLTVLTNRANGTFVLAASPAVGAGPISVTSADVNNDGHPDLISANSSADSLTVLTNDGRGRFASFASPDAGHGPAQVESADLNGDGRPDLISGNYLGQNLSVLFNATVFTGKIVGDGSGLTTVPAEVLTGTLPDARLSANVALLSGTQTFSGHKNFPAGSLFGSGADLTALNASQLSSGTVADARLSTNVALRSGGNIFSGNQMITNGTLRIGNGPSQSQVQFGTATVGAGVAGANTFTITFPTTFSAVPKVFVTAKGNDTIDTFAISTRAVTTTGFKVNIIRVDTALGWGQSLQVDWYAVQ